MAAETRKSGLVIVLGGVGGLDLCGFNMRRLARAGRLPCDLAVIRWGHGFGRWFADLTDVVNRDRRAGEVAAMILGFRDEHPGEPVFLVAKSAGAGVAVRALERLDADVVERAVLLAPALSPRYDLTAALCAVRREIVVFWSPLDVLILGAGTWFFGTIDRVRTWGAGMVGFAVPGPDEPDTERAASTPSSGRCAGGREWRGSAIWAGTSGPIIPGSCSGASCRCSAPTIWARRPVPQMAPTTPVRPALNRGSRSSRPRAPPIS